MWVMARARPVQLFQADSDLLITTFCHYFSLNLTLKASIILLQRKTISNTSHTKQIECKSARACSKNKLFKVIVLSQYFIGVESRYIYRLGSEIAEYISADQMYQSSSSDW